MNPLSTLSEQELCDLASLPFKIGVWMSNAEKHDDHFDAEPEMKALEKILSELQNGSYYALPVRALCAETLKNRKLWPQWVNEPIDITALVPWCMSVMNKHFSKADAQSFENAMIKIAQTVADAHTDMGVLEQRANKGFFFGIFGGTRSAQKTIVKSKEDEAMIALKKAFMG